MPPATTPDGPDSDGDGLSDDVEAWIANNEPKIFRDTTGVVTRVIVERLNAQQMEHTAWDFYGRYNLALENLGNFTFGLNATWAEEYTYDLGTGDPADSGDGVGNQNEQVAEIPPLPEWRVNGTVNWFLGNHAARVRVRWIDGFDLQFNSAGLQTLHGLRGNPDSVDDITYAKSRSGPTTCSTSFRIRSSISAASRPSCMTFEAECGTCV